MKKIYEMPMVELTKFDVEDIMVSGITPSKTEIDTVADKTVVDAVKAAGSYDAVGTYNW